MADGTSTSPSGPLRELPSRWSLPLVGESLAFLRDPASLLAEHARDLGHVFRIRVLGEEVACFVGPSAFELFNDPRYFTREGASPPHVRQLFGADAVPFLADEAFKRRKALLMKAFEPRALDGYLPILERVVARHARRWADLGSFFWQPELDALGLSIAASLFIAADPDRDDPRVERAMQDIVDGVLALPVALPFTTFGRAMRSRAYLMSRIEAAVTARVEGTSRHQDVLQRLLDAKTKDGETLSRDEVHTETLHFFGGYVVVIGGLAWLAVHLAQDAAVRTRLRAEIREQCKRGPLTVARIEAMPYLDRVVRESRRASPTAPITFFARVKEECSFDGFRIPQGMKAIGCIAATLQEERTFPEPKRFDPDRWQGARAGECQHAAWVPHGGGTHLGGHRCAGETLAQLMLKTFAVTLVRDFDWTLPSQDLSPTTGKLFATPKSGLDVRLRRLRADEA